MAPLSHVVLVEVVGLTLGALVISCAPAGHPIVRDGRGAADAPPFNAPSRTTPRYQRDAQRGQLEQRRQDRPEAPNPFSPPLASPAERLAHAIKRCEGASMGERAMCSLELDMGSSDYEMCVTKCTAARQESDALMPERAVAEELRRQLRDEKARVTDAVRRALPKCVAGVMKASRPAVCVVELDVNESQQAECDRSCAEQASAEIRRIVGPPH